MLRSGLEPLADDRFHPAEEDRPAGMSIVSSQGEDDRHLAAIRPQGRQPNRCPEDATDTVDDAAGERGQVGFPVSRRDDSEEPLSDQLAFGPAKQRRELGGSRRRSCCGRRRPARRSRGLAGCWCPRSPWLLWAPVHHLAAATGRPGRLQPAAWLARRTSCARRRPRAAGRASRAPRLGSTGSHRQGHPAAGRSLRQSRSSCAIRHPSVAQPRGPTSRGRGPPQRCPANQGPAPPE